MFSIDDFGSGDYSQEKLRHEIFPLIKEKNMFKNLYLKLDKEILLNLSNKGEYQEKEIDCSFLDFVLSFKKAYKDLNLVIEGVENENSINILMKKYYKNDSFYDFGQGYFFGKPKLFTKDYKQPEFKIYYRK